MMEFHNYSLRDTSDETMERYLSLYENEAVTHIYKYLPPIFLVIGTLSNIFSATIMFKMSYSVLSTCSYLSLLSVMDLTLLYMQCGRDWGTHAFDIDIEVQLQKSSKSACKLYPFFKSFLVHFHSWIMVAIVIDCVIITRFPERIVNMCKVERTQAVMMLLTVLLVLLNIQFFWTFEIIEDDKMPAQYQTECLFNTYGNHFATEFRDIIWPVMDFTLGYGIPLLIVFICCVVTIVSIYKDRQSVRIREELGRLVDPKAIKDMRRAILVTCILYVCMTSPMLVFLLYDYSNDLLKAKAGNKDVSVLVTNTRDNGIPRAICKLIAYVLMSLKFVLYIAFSSRFRYEFVKIWLKTWKCLACRKPLKGIGVYRSHQGGYNSVRQEMDSPRKTNTSRSVNGTPV